MRRFSSYALWDLWSLLHVLPESSGSRVGPFRSHILFLFLIWSVLVPLFQVWRRLHRTLNRFSGANSMQTSSDPERRNFRSETGRFPLSFRSTPNVVSTVSSSSPHFPPTKTSPSSITHTSTGLLTSQPTSPPSSRLSHVSSPRWQT